MVQSFKEVKEVMAEFKSKYSLSKVGAQGFCWGGKYTVLLLGEHLWQVATNLPKAVQPTFASCLEESLLHTHCPASCLLLSHATTVRPMDLGSPMEYGRPLNVMQHVISQ